MPGRTFELAGRLQRPVRATGWSRANRRVVRTIKARPIDLVDADRAAMLPLPPVPPHARLAQPDPVGPRLLRAGRHQRLLRRPDRDRPTWSTSLPTSNVSRSSLDGRIVADHVRGLGAADDRHRPRSCRDRPAAARTVPAATSARPPMIDLVRDLADYDRAFGLDEHGQVA